MDLVQAVFIIDTHPDSWWPDEAWGLKAVGESTIDLQLEPCQECGFSLASRNRQRLRGFRRSSRRERMRAPQQQALLADRAEDPFIVAIVDSGLDVNHPWFVGKIWSNPLEHVDELDNDGNGLVDDVTGWDFVGRDPSPEDALGHGTQMAGLVVQAEQAVHVMPLKVIGAGLGGSANVAAAIDYAVNHRVDVINLSLNSSQSSPEVVAAIERAFAAGIKVVAAAGNRGLSEPEFPANLPEVIAVGAVNRKGRLFRWSSGPGQKGAQYVVAFVNGISTAKPGGGVTRVDGTSAAAAWISGQLAEYQGAEALPSELFLNGSSSRSTRASARKRRGKRSE